MRTGCVSAHAGDLAKNHPRVWRFFCVYAQQAGRSRGSRFPSTSGDRELRQERSPYRIRRVFSSRSRPRGERKITAGAGFHITRVCRDTTYPLKSPNRSSVLQQLHRHPLHKRMEISEVYGSVAQLVVRQIPALKVACSSHAWVNFFLTKYSYVALLHTLL